MKAHSPIGVRIDRSAATVVILLLTVGVAWAGTSLGWGIVLGVLALLALTAASFLRVELLLVSTLTVFTLNQTHMLGASGLLQDARWLMLALGGLHIAVRVMTHSVRRSVRYFDLLAIAGVLYAYFSSAYSTNASLTFQRSTSLLLLYVFVFWLIWDLADRHGEEAIIRILQMCAVVIFTTSIIFAISPEAWQTDGRFRGIMPNPNALGLLAAVYFPLLVWGWTKHHIGVHLLGIFCAATALILSGSRNGLLSVAVALLFLVLFLKPHKLIYAAIILAVVGMVLFTFADPLDWVKGVPTLNRIFDDSSLDYSSGRFESWISIYEDIEDQWLFGHGFGIDAFGYTMLASGQTQIVASHNTYLQVAFQLGLLGLSLLVFPLLLLFVTRLWLVRGRSGLTSQHFLLAVLLASLVSAVFENWIYAAGNAFTLPFWVCVMLLVRMEFSVPNNRRSLIKRVMLRQGI